MAKKIKKNRELETTTLPNTATTTLKPEADIVPEPAPDVVTIDKAQWEQVQNQLKMLTAVADKGRVFNYESQKTEKKPMRIKMSVYQNKIIVGWKTIKDRSIFHPTTGKQVGEEQEYEVELLGQDNVREKIVINGYSTFGNARYDNRIECEVVGKREDYNGKIDYDVVLPDGREISINSSFIN